MAAIYYKATKIKQTIDLDYHFVEKKEKSVYKPLDHENNVNRQGGHFFWENKYSRALKSLFFTA